MAAGRISLDVLKLLIKSGADVNARDEVKIGLLDKMSYHIMILPYKLVMILPYKLSCSVSEPSHEPWFI